MKTVTNRVRKFFVQDEKSCEFCGIEGTYNPNSCECFISDKYNALIGFSTSAKHVSNDWWTNLYKGE